MRFRYLRVTESIKDDNTAEGVVEKDLLAETSGGTRDRLEFDPGFPASQLILPWL